MRVIFLLWFYMLFSTCYAQNLSRNGKTSIYISVNGFQRGDTIILQIWNDLIGDGLSPSEKSGFLSKKFESVLVNGKTQFNLASISKHAYFDLKIRNSQRETRIGGPGLRSLFTSYLVEPGDMLNIHIDSFDFKHGNYINNSFVHSARFFGKGSTKLLCKYLTDSTEAAISQVTNTGNPIYQSNPDSLKIIRRVQYWRKRNQDFIYRIDKQLQVLENFRKSISPKIYNILKANIIGSCQNTYRIFKGDYEFPDGWMQEAIKISPNPELIRSQARNALKILYRDSISHLPTWTISPEAKIYSATYVSMLLSKVKADVAMLYPETNIYERIKLEYSGRLRDRILTWYISGRRDVSDHQDADLNNALSIVMDPTCIKELNRIKNSINIGAKAFNFSFRNLKNEIVSLDALRGKVVFMDFWFTGCVYCAKYYDGVLKKVEEHYKSSNKIVFVSISIDKDMHSWIKSVNKGDYTSPDNPNVINLYTNGMGSTHPIISHYSIPNFPHLLLIDKQGRIADNSQLALRANDSGYEALIQKIDELIRK